MSTIRVATNFNIDIEFTAPSFGRRLFAWILDIIVQIFYLMVAGRILSAIEGGLSYTEQNSVMMLAITWILRLPFLLYHFIMEATNNGQSIGKKIMGIRVVSENGGRPSIGQLIIRSFIRTADNIMLVIIAVLVIMSNNSNQLSPEIWAALCIAILLLVTDLILVNTRKQQRLGDILARTVLVDIKQKGKITDTVFLEVSEKYVPQFPQIMRLSDRDMNSLKGIIDAARKHKDYQMAYVAAEKIKAHLNITTHLAPEEFLQILLQDYNYLSAN